MTAQVEICGTSFCRYCLAALGSLKSKQIDYTEYLVNLLPLERGDVLRSCGRKKVPQILINGVPIGGDEDLIALDMSGEFDRLLKLA